MKNPYLKKHKAESIYKAITTKKEETRGRANTMVRNESYIEDASKEQKDASLIVHIHNANEVKKKKYCDGSNIIQANA